jgi:asparagine N-glycosylation enzyme membrane subunit Stt3
MKSKHWPEAVASFFVVGLGQIVKGEGDKGLKMMLVFYLAMPASLYATLLINGYLFLLTMALVIISGIILWAYNVWDAFKHEPLV